jgi:hypothetical protein
MTQMGCCSYFRRTAGKSTASICSKYDSYMRKSLLINYDVPSAIELRATLGRQIVSKLPAHFRSENNGRFIAVTFTGEVLAVCNTLESLNKEIAKKNPKENYYIERIGYRTITQI